MLRGEQKGSMQSFDEIDHAAWMREAIREAQAAQLRGDPAIGAIIVHDGRVIARGSNRTRSTRSKLAHAETEAILASPSFLYDHGTECILYTTSEPCIMCLGTIILANIRHIVFGAYDPRCGGAPLLNVSAYAAERVEHYMGGVLEEECRALDNPKM